MPWTDYYFSKPILFCTYNTKIAAYERIFYVFIIDVVTQYNYFTGVINTRIFAKLSIFSLINFTRIIVLNCWDLDLSCLHLNYAFHKVLLPF